MFFLVSKLLDFFLTPSNLIALTGVAGIVVSVRSWRAGWVLLATAMGLLAIGGWSPLGPAILRVLENRFALAEIQGTVAGFILLGGAVDTHITAERGDVALNEGGERLAVAATLSRQYPRARIFLSGGASHILRTGAISESAAARRILVGLGVEGSRIEMEERSRNTCENAIETKASVQPAAGEQWVLITSANHMPRAIACFRAQGFKVVPYPVDYRTRGGIGPLSFADTISKGLTALDLAAHEWIGLATYRAFGLTEEFFPKP